MPLCLFRAVNPKSRCEKPLTWPDGTTQRHPPKRCSLGQAAQLVHHTNSPHPWGLTRMRKDQPHIANSLLESISLLDRARSHCSLQMGDYPAVLWYDPHLLHKTPGESREALGPRCSAHTGCAAILLLCPSEYLIMPTRRCLMH